MAEQPGFEEGNEEAIDQISVENQELEKLEEDVKLMADKIAQIRENLPDQLRNTVTSILSAKRSVDFILSDNAHGPPSGDTNPDGLALAEDDLTRAETIQAIQQKILNEKSAMSTQLKRMKDCMSIIDKLDSNKGIIYPAFKNTPSLI